MSQLQKWREHSLCLPGVQTLSVDLKTMNYWKKVYATTCRNKNMKKAVLQAEDKKGFLEHRIYKLTLDNEEESTWRMAVGVLKRVGTAAKWQQQEKPEF